MRQFALALVLLLNRLLVLIEDIRREREVNRRQKEREELRDDPVEWWLDNFGVDGGNDSRLSDAAGEDSTSTNANKTGTNPDSH